MKNKMIRLTLTWKLNAIIEKNESKNDIIDTKDF